MRGVARQMVVLMLRKLFCLALIVATALPALAQSEEKAKRSQSVQAKFHQADLLIQILPLVLTKDQINKLLPAIEQVRAKQKKALEFEDDEIIKLEAKINPVIDAAFEKGTYPPRDIQLEIFKITKALAVRRSLIRAELVDSVYAVVDRVFNAGQKKAAANSLDWKALDPTAVEDPKSDEQKIKFFVRWVLIDPGTYDILLKLVKIAS
jgi:hypothetical protein